MSRFVKIMAALSLLAVVAVFFFLGSVAGLIGKFSDKGLSLKETHPHITELKIEGVIMASEAILESIQRISEDETCKGILLRIDSPGGAVGASQEIFTALKSLKLKGLPIIVSQGNLAASGGYYISLAGDKIFANPGTLTGSIGVIMQFPEASKLMDKVGVGLYTVKSGPLKDIGNYSRTPTADELKFLQSVIDNTYNQFVDDVLTSRKIERTDLLKVADGRIMTGLQAKSYGLVDTLGGYKEAKTYLAKIANLDSKPIVLHEPPEKSWAEQLMESKTSTSLGPLAEAATAMLPQFHQGIYYLWK